MTPEKPSFPTFGEALRLWWKLGWISFGGPAGQISMMHREIIEKRRWMTEEHFLHALNFCMLLPGPEAQQLVTYLGWRLHGARGGIAAGALFVLPSAFILFGLAWLYMTGSDITWIQGIFQGMIPAVIAIVAAAVKRIGSKALKTPALWIVAALSFVSIFFFHISFVLILAAAALIGWVGGKHLPHQFPAGKGHAATTVADLPSLDLPPSPRGGFRRASVILTVCLLLWWLPVLAVGIFLGWKEIHFQEGLFFSKAALITFGGAYAVLPYVSQVTVGHYGWLDQRQMMAGLGLAETTPGPLIMVLQFVGFVAAWQNPPAGWSPLAAAALGAGITTWATFVPCFLFVFLGAPHVEGLRDRPAIARVLNTITAAVVGVILNLAVWFAWNALKPDGTHTPIFMAVTAIAAWFAMERFKIGVIPVLGACAVLGLGWAVING